MIEFIKQKNKAFTLVEMMVAVSIFTVSILGMISILASGLSNTSYAKQKMVATYLAQEGIEYMRNMRDTSVLYNTNNGWYAFKNKLSGTGSSCLYSNGCYFDDQSIDYTLNGSQMINNNDLLPCDSNHCSNHPILYSESTGKYGYESGGVNSGFSRQIKAEIITDNEIKITSTVYWQQGSGEKSVSFSENLTNT